MIELFDNGEYKELVEKISELYVRMQLTKKILFLSICGLNSNLVFFFILTLQKRTLKL